MFGFRNQPFNLVLEWPVFETKRPNTMKPLSDKAVENLKRILLTEIGEAKVKLLNKDDLQKIGLFLLTVHAEACKRKMRLVSR